MSLSSSTCKIKFSLRKNNFSLLFWHFTKFSSKAKFFRSSKLMTLPSSKFYVWQDFNAEDDTASRQRCIQIALDFSLPSKGINGQRLFMKRAYLDKFDGTKKRLLNKINALLKRESENTILIQAITEDGKQIEENTNNFEVFFGSRPCKLIKIDEIEYLVVRDTVWLDKIEIALEPLIGCPLMPSTDWKGENSNVKYHWFIGAKKRPLNIKFVGLPVCQFQLDGWEYAHTGPYYCPKEADFEKYIAVIVEMSEDGMADGAICAIPVKRPNDGGELIFEPRQAQYCQDRLGGDRYRVMSYNVLAHLYLKDWLKKSQAEQYYPYCPTEFQSDKYRYPLLLREIPGYNVDILFLQEVDFRFQKRFLIPFLQMKGYTPIFNCKQNQVNEGMIVAYRSDRFETESVNYTFKLSELLDQHYNSDICKFLKANPEIYKILTTRPTILQLVHLRTLGGLNILAGNTHLHFDPLHEPVKILQALLCIRCIASLIAHKVGGLNPQVIFAGDFNCHPLNAAIRMFQGEQIQLYPQNKSETFIQRLLAYLQRNNWLPGKPNKGLIIQEPLNFQCLSGFPEYTNYTKVEGIPGGFSGCLDYIWANPPVQVDHILPMPDHKLVTKFGAIPSKACPSDHLPIICELTLPSPS